LFTQAAKLHLATASATDAASLSAVTWHHTDFTSKDFAGGCYATTDGAWAPTQQAGVDSAKQTTQNTWSVDLSAWAKANSNISAVLGLRLNGGRSIRAKYPNGDPEKSGEWFVSTDPGMGNGDYVEGWITGSTEWVTPQRKPDAEEIIVKGTDWPGVHWPATQEGGSSWTGEGDWGDFHIGMGGYCDDIEPPTGYWCSMEPPRGQCFDNKTRTSRGCTQTHMSPDGLSYGASLPHAANYSDAKGAVVQVWRGGGRWFTNLCLVESQDKAKGTLTFDAEVGCNQGGEGEVQGSQWWIENVREECDDANEWFYDENTKELLYSFNGTSAPTGDEEWVAVHTKVLFNATGSQHTPLKNFKLSGLELRDAAYTYDGEELHFILEYRAL
jgi:hypothetical protein